MPAVLDPPAATTPPPAYRPQPFAPDAARVDDLARRAFAACRPPAEPVERFAAEVLTPLREWCAARADRVQAAWVTPPRDGVMWAYVILRQARDFSLGDETGRLTDAFWAAGWRVFASALPPPVEDGSLSSFYTPDTALLAYADR